MEREDLEYIKKFGKITIAEACRHFNINQSNLRRGSYGKEVEKKVRKYLENKLSKIYWEECEVYVKDNSLLDR